MKDEEILKKAIGKAIKNGWGGWVCPWRVVRRKKLVMVELQASKIGFEDSDLHPWLLIYDHDFARAFWGDKHFFHNPMRTQKDYRKKEEVATRINASEFTWEGEEWQYHLQQMVLEADPIKYLEDFLT